jgi:hypothetical protein
MLMNFGLVNRSFHLENFLPIDVAFVATRSLEQIFTQLSTAFLSLYQTKLNYSPREVKILRTKKNFIARLSFSHQTLIDFVVGA